MAKKPSFEELMRKKTFKGSSERKSELKDQTKSQDQKSGPKMTDAILVDSQEIVVKNDLEAMEENYKLMEANFIEKEQECALLHEQVQALARKVSEKPNIEIDLITEMDKILLFTQALDEQAHPSIRPIITRLKKYHRPAFLQQCLYLLLMYLRQRGI